jgi:lactose/L-arabinose transport system permease protein
MGKQAELTSIPIRKPEHRAAAGGRLWKDLDKARWGLFFISPFFLLYAIFGLYPLVYSFILAFTDWTGKGPLEFSGLTNLNLILKDQVFWQAMRNGAILFFMYVPLQTFLALVLAVVLNSKRVRGFAFFRTLIFMPYVTNMVAAGYTFQLLLNQKYGLFNAFLNWFGIASVPWLDSVWGARASLCLLIVWAWLGYNMVIMLAGLQTIPNDYCEAALIDGASPVQAFFYITIPLMRPVILFVVVLSTMGSFGLFAETISLFPSTFGSGPLNATVTPILAIYNQAFRNFRFGYASTMAYVYFAFIFALTFFQVRYFGRNEESEGC